MYIVANNLHCATCWNYYSIKLGRLSWGCPILDSQLGGVLVPGVTELSGVSAAGKTQLCLQLSLMVQLSQRQGGLDGGD